MIKFVNASINNKKIPECVGVKDPPEVVDVELRLDVLLAVEGDEGRLVSLPDEVESVPNLLKRFAHLADPILAIFVSVPLL